MKDILVVVDMQNDFVIGSLGTKEAKAILPRVVEKIEGFDGEIYFTRDTHEEDYLNTQEGKVLPVKHCIKGTEGWELHPEIQKYAKENIIDKVTFGSKELAEKIEEVHGKEKIDSITLVGLCTDICVISNALILKAFIPEVKIIVDENCCAGVSPESHERALESMKACQIFVE
ncbi:isochorismatase family cysteine hydrolase [Lagierella sp.]|uniref:cysteine hydrolase family protein n=1 Tax=Lagierella sp. TaxID=2849657 RepID=UPI00261EFF67|nr:isochorismatase family cysteine hydrolase [Lagierella sp.]